MALQVFAQPFDPRPRVAARQGLVQIGHRGAHRRVQATRIDVAQRIGREIAEQPDRPVDVLQHPVRRPVHRNAEIPEKARVPRLGQVVGGQPPRDQVAFQVEPHHDVQVVLDLVGLGADIAWGHAVDGAIEFVGVRDRQAAGHVRHPPVQPPGKGPAPSHLVFIDARLAFMDAHRHATSQRRQRVVGVDAQFIAGMADLVDRRIDAVERVGFHDPRGDPAVLPAAGRERVDGDVHPAARPVIAKGGRAGARQAQLHFLREPTLQPLRLVGGAQDILAQGDQPGSHRVKQPGQFGLCHARFVIVQQRVIGVAVAETRSQQGVRGILFQHHDLVQRGQEILGRVVGARRGPDALGQARLPGDLGRQLGGDGAGAAVIAGDQGENAFLARGPGVRRLDPFADAGIGAPLVQHRLHRGHLFGPLFGGAPGHHGFLIPGEPFGHGRQRLGLALERQQLRHRGLAAIGRDRRGSGHRIVPRTLVSKG